MNNLEMAKSYRRQAQERLRHAREALDSGSYPYVVRQCQEAVELLLKAALRVAGIEPPKWHDVGPLLRINAERFPEWFRGEIPKLSRISRRLRREREPSVYGDEEAGIPPDELYFREDAEEALEMAEYTLNVVSKLIQSIHL
jgi:HEPN domain-containing protein